MSSKIIRAAIVYAVGIILVIVFALIFWATHSILDALVYKYLKRTDKKIWKYVIIFAFIILEGLVLLLFQLVGKAFIHALTHKVMKFQTHSEEEKVEAMVLWKIQFLSVVIPIYFLTIYIGNYNYFGRLGLVEFIQIYYFIEILYVVFLIIILFFKTVLDLVVEYLCCCCPITKKNSLRKFLDNPEKYRTSKNSRIFTQFEANEIIRKKQWDLSGYYSSMIKTFMISLFFFFVFPPSMLLGLVLITIDYIYYRFKLIKSSNKIKRYSRKISKMMGIQLGWAILIAALALILHQKSIRLANLSESLRLSFFMIVGVLFGILIGFVGVNLLIDLAVGEMGEFNRNNYYESFGQDNDDGYRAFRDKGDEGLASLLNAVDQMGN